MELTFGSARSISNSNSSGSKCSEKSYDISENSAISEDKEKCPDEKTQLISLR
jgi:hypothetical protein